MSDIDYSELGGASRPQEGRSNIVRASLDALNRTEYQKMNRIIQQEYDVKQATILDQTLGQIINNTVNFFGNSMNLYHDKYLEAEFGQKIYKTEYTTMDKLQTHLIATSLFVRDSDNIIYLGIIMILLSVLMTFFNLSRGYGSNQTVTKS